MIDKAALAKLTAELVSSYVGNSTLSDEELDRAIERLPVLIDRVHVALLKIVQSDDLAGHALAPAPDDEVRTRASEAPPAVDPADSVHDDYLVCLEDGRRFKTLRRHIWAKYQLTPDAYRRKWKLPADYPMACKSYADSRAQIAKRIGLGAGGRGGQPTFPERAAAPSRRAAKPPTRRGAKPARATVKGA
jgi:predicted transcriptional regulator